VYRPGNREDFDRLYEATYPKLLRTVYAVLGDHAAAEDCVQDAFVRAYQAWPRFRPERPAEAWLHQIAINGAISYRRKQRLRQVGELLRRLGRPHDETDPADTVIAGEVVAALSQLPVKLAAAFVLRYYHGYSNREIAATMGVSERMVGLRLAQARERLVRLLGPGWGLPVSSSPGVPITKSGDA